MFIRKFGQEYRQICVTDSYQQVHENYDNFAAQTGLHSAFAMESFAGAVTKIGSANGTIIVEKVVPITADYSVAANIHVDIRKGGSFAVSSGKTLTFLGNVNTNGQPVGTVFTGAGSVVYDSHGVFTQIDSGIGRFIGGSDQDIYEQSLTQNFDVGTRRVVDDRVFRYCKAGDTLVALFGGRCTNFPREGSTDAVEYAAGTYQITIPMNPNGVNYVAEQVANYWKDGYIWIMQWPIVTGVGQMYRIRSSAAAVSGFVTLTLYEALKTTVAASTWITAWPNVYQGIKTAASVRMSVVCIPLIPVTSGYYFWGQTWGPIFMASGQSPGRNDYDRDLYFHPMPLTPGQQGVVCGSSLDFSTLGNKIPQRAGFIITNTSAWTNADGNPELGGDQFFMLQISP